ncbi:MAG: EFR1 family ferrodoxin [Clostridia bacterium]|nr:EFR1 family ferrodoxin [Clostridia bacterium]
MKCLLLYYTGTFNTRYLTRLLKARLEACGAEVTTYELDPLKPEKLDLTGYDTVGLGYPIYGFNAPCPFLKFVRKQTFPKGIRAFIYKNSGETYHANDASSVNLWRKLRRDGALIENEYHFMMPYNIHFRFDEALVREMLVMDDLLLDVLVKEVVSGIPNIKKYRLIHRIVTFFVKLQYIGGDVNSFFCKVKEDQCIRCGKCVRDCPTRNIYQDADGKIRFRHNCLMCMRCSLNCPADAVRIGFLDWWGWRVNGPYDLDRLHGTPPAEPVITEDTQGFFRCYVETYQSIRRRHEELFGDSEK